MTHTESATGTGAETSSVRRSARIGVAVILVGALLFFAALAGLSAFRDFLAGSEDAQASTEALMAQRLEVLADHRGQVLAGFLLVAVGELLLGVGMWVIATGVSRAESGWRAAAASAAAWSCLAGAGLALAVQSWPTMWLGDDRGVAELGLSGTTSNLLVIAWVLLSAGFLACAVVLATGGRWPIWPGAVLAVFGLLPLVTKLPLFFQLGAVIAGVGLARSGGGRLQRSRGEREAAARPS